MPARASSFQPDHAEGALGPYLRAVRAHLLLVVAVTLVAVGAGAGWATTRTKTYQATAQVLVTPLSSGDSAGTGLPLLNESVEPQRTLQTAATMLESPTAAVAVAQQVPGWSPTRVETAVQVQPRGETNVVAVTASAPSASGSQTVANAYARAALAQRQASLRQQVQRRILDLQARRHTLGRAGAQTTAAADLAGQLSELQAIRDGQDPNFSLLQAATPGKPTGAPTWLIGALALIAGLALGSGGALALQHLDRRVRDEEEMLGLYPLPVLARVPPLPRRRAGAITGLLTPGIREAFRTIQVQLAADGYDSRAIMLTSASAADGKTTCSINLATSLAEAGYRVILLDLDLRKPDVGSRLGLRSDLLPLLRANSSLEQLLVQHPELPSLRVLSAPVPGDVTPLLETLHQRLPVLLDEAGELADYVLIDTAPVGRVSDALRMAGAVDDVILVARPGHTERADLNVARDLLERMGYTPIGIVLVGETAGSAAYGYGYDYGTPEAETAPAEPTGPRRLEVLRGGASAVPADVPPADALP